MGMARLLENALLDKIGMLRFAGPRRVSGTQAGERRSMLRGASMEIADFRAYVQGDDVRYIDWNAMARFDQPVVRLFVDQRAMPVTIVLDASASMQFGSPDKFDFSKKLAAALGWIGLARQDRVVIHKLGGVGPSGRLHSPKQAAFLAKADFARLHEFLESLQAGGIADVESAAAFLANQKDTGGLTVVISDFLGLGISPEIWRRLMVKKQEVRLIHVICPQELRPQFTGATRLVDAESGSQLDIVPSRRALEKYDQRLKLFLSTLRERARKDNISYALLRSDENMEAVLFDALTHAGILER